MLSISVIIPIFNGQKYLKECIESIQKQTFSDFEILCINDGSSDNSEDIIKELSINDKRIKYVKQYNQGVSDARNTGLLLAKGEYIHFIDQDDIIDHRMYEVMYKKAKELDLDLISSNVTFFGRNNTKKYDLPIVKNTVLSIDSKEIEKYVNSFFSESLCQGAIWNKLYRRDLILKSTRFQNRMLVKSEDTIFSILVLLTAKRSMFINDFFYRYRVCSTSQSRYLSIKDVDLTFNMFNFLADKIPESVSWSTIFLKSSFTKNISFHLIQLVMSSRIISISDKTLILKRVFKHHFFDEDTFKEHSIKAYVLYFLYKCNCLCLLSYISYLFSNKTKTHLDFFEPYD